MELTYQEVEELKKKADVYELQPGQKYLIVFRADIISNPQLEVLTQVLHRSGISGVMLKVTDTGGLKIFEMKGE